MKINRFAIWFLETLVRRLHQFLEQSLLAILVEVAVMLVALVWLGRMTLQPVSSMFHAVALMLLMLCVYVLFYKVLQFTASQKKTTDLQGGNDNVQS